MRSGGLAVPPASPTAGSQALRRLPASLLSRYRTDRMNVRAHLETRMAKHPAPGLGWALHGGRPMPAAIRPWSPSERRLIGLVERGVHAPWGHCFSSAQRATLLASELGPGPHELLYCEGFARSPGLAVPFAHAWCLLNDQVWDLTPQFRDLRMEYFGQEISTPRLHHAVARRRAWGPVMLSALPPVFSPTA